MGKMSLAGPNGAGKQPQELTLPKIWKTIQDIAKTSLDALSCLLWTRQSGQHFTQFSVGYVRFS